MAIGQTSKDAATMDQELWSEDIAWLLLSCESALGAGGTTGPVISAIQRGGASGAGDMGRLHDAAISRVGSVERARRLFKLWCALGDEQRRILVAHYVGSISASSRIKARFGLLAGVVVEQWLKRNAKRRDNAQSIARNATADRLELVYLELEPREARLKLAGDTAQRERVFLALETRVRLSQWVRLHPIARALSEARLLRALSAERLALAAVRPLRSRRDQLLSEHAATYDGASDQRALEDLEFACQGGEPAGLKARAEGAVREAHRAWDATRAAMGHPAESRARTKREKRQERVELFFRKVDS